MNAADQRHLTPWLIAACVVLAGIWLALLAGVGGGVNWKPPLSPHPVPSAHQIAATQAPPLGQYADIWQRPLFTVTRQPAPESAGGGNRSVSLDNLELTGVILAPGMRMALLRDRGDGHGVRVREGEHLGHGDWILDSLKPRSAVFVDDGRRTRLTLKSAAQHAATPPAGVDDAARPATAAAATSPATSVADPPRHGSAAGADQREHIEAIKQRIEQRRRDQATPAGDQ